MPLGKRIWQEKSKATGTRYVDASMGKGLNIEVNFIGEIEGYGLMEGMKGRIVGTDSFWENLSDDRIMPGTAHGALQLESGEMIPFKAIGLGKSVIRNFGKVGAFVVSLVYFIDPPPELSWMRTTPIVWEAIVDPRSQSIEATAYAWEMPERKDG